MGVEWQRKKQGRDGLLCPLAACLFDCGSAKLMMIAGSLGAGLRLEEQTDSAGGAGSRGDREALFDLMHFSWFSLKRINIQKNVNNYIKNVQQTYLVCLAYLKGIK